MADTLGSLCDKLTIIKLKEWHTDDPERLNSLAAQAVQLQAEIDELVGSAVAGLIPINRLQFRSNKVYTESGNEFARFVGTIGEVFSSLAAVNCELWHQQEKVYAFQQVPTAEKDTVVNSLATLNLSRNQCIDEIDSLFCSALKKIKS
jgi:hypothetical protein